MNAEDRETSEETAPRHPPTPSDKRLHEERIHEEAEHIAVEGDDLSELFAAVLGPEKPHVDEAPPGGVSWPPRLGRKSAERAAQEEEHRHGS
jgi:hypothetical protein